MPTWRPWFCWWAFQKIRHLHWFWRQLDFERQGGQKDKGGVRGLVGANRKITLIWVTINIYYIHFHVCFYGFSFLFFGNSCSGYFCSLIFTAYFFSSSCCVLSFPQLKTIYLQHQNTHEWPLATYFLFSGHWPLSMTRLFYPYQPTASVFLPFFLLFLLILMFYLFSELRYYFHPSSSAFGGWVLASWR